MREINAEQLREIVSSDEDVLLINVLSEKDFREHHIPGSINIPVDKDDFVKEVENRAGSKDRKVIVYCANTECDASPKAARKLEDAGFTNVVDFTGGMKAWEEANQPVETGAR